MRIAATLLIYALVVPASTPEFDSNASEFPTVSATAISTYVYCPPWLQWLCKPKP